MSARAKTPWDRCWCARSRRPPCLAARDRSSGPRAKSSARRARAGRTRGSRCCSGSTGSRAGA